MNVDFRAPCGTDDTLLAQYPITSRSVNQIAHSNGLKSNQLENNKSTNDFSGNQTGSITSGRSSDGESITSLKDSNSSQSDELWTMPPGQNPWKARQQQLENMSPGKK
jgi:hypothetical protein